LIEEFEDEKPEIPAASAAEDEGESDHLMDKYDYLAERDDS
jgi:hypothetical protein